MTLEAEMEGVALSKECGATRSWTRQEGPSPSALRRSVALHTSGSALWPPELGENTFLMVKFLELCYGSLSHISNVQENFPILRNKANG